MKKLEDIPKKQVFTVPEHYFDKLPGVLQSRIEARGARRETFGAYSWKLALPAVIVAVAGVFWLIGPAEPADAESILASVETPDLVAYLNESDDVSIDDVLESVEFNHSDADEIENEVYVLDLNGDEVESLMNELD